MRSGAPLASQAYRRTSTARGLFAATARGLFAATARALDARLTLVHVFKPPVYPPGADRPVLTVHGVQ